MDELTRAKKRALYLLTDMDRTEQQLYEKLKKAGYSERVIAETMSYVRGYGYIDDRRYARHYIETMKSSRSKRRIHYDLLKKGIPKELLEQTFEEEGDYDESPLIEKLAEKKLRTLNSEDAKRKDKIARFLAGKGFSPHDIYDVLDRLL